MDKEIQNDELAVLESIYINEGFSYQEDNHQFKCSLKISLSLPEGYYFEYKDIRQADAELTKVLISHLPPLTVEVTLPSDYPSVSPPVFTMTSSWLCQPLLSKLCKKLDELWQENKGEEVLFTWFSFLQNETLEFLNIREGLNISDIYTQHRIALDNVENQETSIEASNASGLSEEIERPFDKRVVLDLPVSENPVENLIDYNYLQTQIESQNIFHTCNICFSDKVMKVCTKFVPCDHIFCKECVVGFFEVRINEGTVENILCPENKCLSEATPGQVKDLVSTELFSKYDRLLLNSTLNTMNEFIYCPRRHCQYPVSLEANEKSATCPECHYTFCVECKMPYHGINPCNSKGDNKPQFKDAFTAQRERIEKRLKNIRYNFLESAENWSPASSKTCPFCKSTIEKIGGCNVMTCGRCRKRFCWVCRKKFEGKTSIHFSCKK